MDGPSTRNMDGVSSEQTLAEATRKSEFEHLERLNEQIDKFEKNLAVLETRLRPVLVSFPETEEALIESAPDHEFHVVIQRLANVNDALDGLINRVRL